MLSLRLLISCPAPSDQELDQEPDQASVIDVEVLDDARWSHLHQALRHWGFGESFTVEGKDLDRDFRIGDPPLLDGALICSSPMDSSGRERRDDPGSDEVPLHIVCESGPQQTRRWPLTAGSHALGRGHPVIGPDPLVSRQHAHLTYAHGEVRVRDAASLSGTYVEGTPVEHDRSAPWSYDQHLRLGGTALRLSTSPTARGEGVPDGHGHVRHEPSDPLPTITAREVEWPSIPAPTAHTGVRWIAVLAPVPVAIGLALWLRTPVLLAFMIFSPLVMLLTGWDDRRRGRSNSRRAIAAAKTAQDDLKRDLNAVIVQERTHLRALLHGPAELTAIARGEARAARETSSGPGRFRLGYGRCASKHSVTLDGASRSLVLTDVPVSFAVVPGCLHLRTTDDHETTQVMELLAAAAAVTPAGTETVTVATPLLSQRRWCWIADGFLQTHAALTDLPEEHGPGDTRIVRERERPAVHLVDARTPGASEHVRRLDRRACCIIWVGPSPPPFDAVEWELRAGFDASCSPDGHHFTLDGPPTSWFPTTTRLARRWSPPTIRHDAATAPPSRVTPADLPDVDTSLCWGSRGSTDVPIGIGAGGEIVRLDLARHGPHALVAGTTGSGKSEFLLGYLHALFTLNSPAQVTALLIDYKGGATFGPLADVPHVVGVVSDLDEGLGARALTGLHAEIRRRERLLADRGHASYDEAKACDSTLDLPRLFVVVDEFRVLAEELPEFVTGLVRVASVGRSLGLHLVMATQRPGGVVTADMRANLDARLALRVRERSDSLDVIDSPVAARLPRTAPGRAVLAVGGESLVEVQTTFVSGRVRSSGSPEIRGRTWDGAPLEPFTSEAGREEQGRESASSYLEELVSHIRARQLDLPAPHIPVLPPLPSTLPRAGSASDGDLLPTASVTWSGLADRDPRPSTVTRPMPLPLAWVDLPHAQCRALLDLPNTGHVGIAGAPRSGRTTAARRCAQVAHARGDEVWWLGIGDGDGTCVSNPLEAADPQDVVRFMERLGTPSGPTVMIVDGWEGTLPTLSRINHGGGLESMMELIHTAHTRDIVMVVTGGRSVLSSRVAPLLDSRVVLRQNDTSEYSLAGLRPTQVPLRMPPGRGLVLPHAHEIHFHLPEEADDLWQP